MSFRPSSSQFPQGTETCKRNKLRQEIVQGCQDMAEVYLEVEREYHPLVEEVDWEFWIPVEPRQRSPNSELKPY